MKTILKKTINLEVQIPMTSNDVADLFWEMDATAQAEFFNRLGQKDRLAFQLQAVTDSKSLTIVGRTAMSRIGEYSLPQ